MNTVEVVRNVACVKNFLGVFPRDKLPIINSYPCFLIINTDKSTDPGEHWVAIHFTRNNFREYFDSFGLPPIHSSIPNFITLHSPLGFAYNNTTLQHMFSGACGNYCIFFVCMRSSCYTISDILSMYSENVYLNDSFVKHVTKRMVCKTYEKNCLN